MTTEKKAGTSIQVIGRMMNLLDILATHPTPVALKQLALETGLHPSTAHRILAVMVNHQFVERDEPGTYRLGIRLMELGNLVKSRIRIRKVAFPHMQALQHALGETVHLAVRRDDDIVYVERAQSDQSMRIVQLIGTRTPLHVTAVGKIFLAEGSAAALAEYVQRTGLPRHTDNTITRVEALTAEFEKVKALGYAVDNEEAERGVSSIGAGIYNDESQIVAGVSVSAPSDRLKPVWAAQIRQTALDISRALGYRT